MMDSDDSADFDSSIKHDAADTTDNNVYSLIHMIQQNHGFQNIDGSADKYAVISYDTFINQVRTGKQHDQADNSNPTNDDNDSTFTGGTADKTDDGKESVVDDNPFIIEITPSLFVANFFQIAVFIN